MMSVKYLAFAIVVSVSSLVFAQGPVSFVDANLKAAVEAELGISDPTAADMLLLTQLSADTSGIADITGLEHALNLAELTLTDNQISDVSALSGLTNLEVLFLPFNQISNLSPLAGLTNLEWLLLGHNNISDVSPLSGLVNLDWLYLSDNQITNLSPLSGLTSLTRLLLDENQISSVSALSGLTNLDRLMLGVNQISDISALSGLTSLTRLHLHGNQVSDISPLSGLTNLEWLLLQFNQISDISVLSGLTNLERLYLHGMQISDISALAGLANLDWLNLQDNPLDQAACFVHIPQIISNNPGINLSYDQCPIPYSIIIASGPGGAVTNPGEGPFAYANISVVPVVATADAGFHFLNWAGTAVDAGKVDDPSSASTSVTVDGDHTLVANFAPNGGGGQYVVVVNSTAGGSTNQDGSHTINHGDALVINPTPSAGYHFTGWTGDASGSSDPLTVTVTSAMTITANFAINQYTVVVNSTAGGSTDRDGSNTVNHGDALTITPLADLNYLFTGWSGDATGAGAPLTITVTSNLSVTASFERTVKPPEVVTYPAKDIGQTSATLRGYMPSDGGDPDYEYRFRWWKEGDPEPGPGDGAHESTWTAKTSLNGSSTFESDLPENGGPQFEPGSTYRYRAIGRNSAGSDQGGIQRFTTLAALYVDDNAPGDPGPHDMAISDPQEDGSKEHPFDSVQEAIEAARQYDSVVVREGIYYETINLLGRNINLTSFDPSSSGTTAFALMAENVDLAGFDPSLPENPAYPVIDANGMGTVVTFNHHEDPNCILSGFVLTGGYGNPAGAILCDGSSPTIHHCLIVGNRCPDPNASEPHGAAVFCVDSDSVFEHCTIADNYGGANGVGLYSVDSNVIMANTIIWGNLPGQVQVESGTDPMIVYSDIQGAWPGLGNIAEDPNFVHSGYWADRTDPWLWPTHPSHPEAVWVDGDYRLGQSSPCIDSGDINWPYLDHPYHHREAVDMGAYGF